MTYSSADPAYIFVGGLQRSGTTLLGRLLASHSLVAGLVGTPTAEDEGQFVHSEFPDDHAMGREVGGRRAQAISWAYHDSAHLVSVSAGRSARDMRAGLDRAWGPYWSRPDAAYRVEKSPSNLTRTRLLQELFPGSRFVIITRHPMAYVAAIRKWTPYRTRIGLSPEKILDHWFAAMDTFRADSASLHSVSVVAYEDLVRGPQSALQGISKILGLPESGYDVAQVSNQNARYSRYWSQYRVAKRSRSKFEPLTSAGRMRAGSLRLAERLVFTVEGERLFARIHQQYGSRMAAYGYSVDSLDSARDWFSR